MQIGETSLGEGSSFEGDPTGNSTPTGGSLWAAANFRGLSQGLAGPAGKDRAEFASCFM